MNFTIANKYYAWEELNVATIKQTLNWMLTNISSLISFFSSNL